MRLVLVVEQLLWDTILFRGLQQSLVIDASVPLGLNHVGECTEVEQVEKIT